MKQLIFLFSLVLFSTSFVGAQVMEEVGLASYYADQFHGKPTASGELYDKFKLTAAHRTLPFGTKIKVTRLDNGKSVIVTVNDRGPFHAGRLVEVSGAAADLLDLKKDGVAKVRIEVVPAGPSGNSTAANQNNSSTRVTEQTQPTSSLTAKGATQSSGATAANRGESKKAESSSKQPSSPNTQNSKGTSSATFFEITPTAATGYGVQVAAFSNEDSMLRKVEELKAQWFKDVIVATVDDGKGGKIYKVIIGPFDSEVQARTYKDNLKKNKKINGFVVNLSNL